MMNTRTEQPSPDPSARRADPPEAQWAAPPRTLTEAGRERRVGVEIEFSDLSAVDAAKIVAARFGGEVAVDSEFRADVTGGTLGDFRCELDAKFAHRRLESERWLWVRELAASLSAEVLPIEIICPPIRWSACHVLDDLCADLAEAGARGTQEHPLYAFGAQLNPELASTDMDDVLGGLRAFLVMRGWLRDRIGVDPSRKLWSFEARFPKRYAALVLDRDYAPDAETLIDDYLRHNPTRNRELDLLPLFAFMDEDRVRAALPDETINARPTWHYRLPNCALGRPGWSLAREWGRWVALERLAASRPLLRHACDMVLSMAESEPEALRRELDVMGEFLCRRQ